MGGFRYHICRLPCGDLALVEGQGEAEGGGLAVASGRILVRNRGLVQADLPCRRKVDVVEHILAEDELGAVEEYARQMARRRGDRV